MFDDNQVNVEMFENTPTQSTYISIYLACQKVVHSHHNCKKNVSMGFHIVNINL